MSKCGCCLCTAFFSLFSWETTPWLCLDQPVDPVCEEEGYVCVCVCVCRYRLLILSWKESSLQTLTPSTVSFVLTVWQVG